MIPVVTGTPIKKENVRNIGMKYAKVLRYLTSCSRRSRSACRCLAPRIRGGCGCNEPESVWGGRSEPRPSGCGSPGRSEDEETQKKKVTVTATETDTTVYSYYHCHYYDWCTNTDTTTATTT